MYLKKEAYLYVKRDKNWTLAIFYSMSHLWLKLWDIEENYVSAYEHCFYKTNYKILMP